MKKEKNYSVVLNSQILLKSVAFFCSVCVCLGLQSRFMTN